MFSIQLFYLTSEQLCAYAWRKGQLSAPQCFAADAAGAEAFAHYLDGRGQVPAYLLTDLIEEDFQRHLLPHVGGRSGRGLRQRRLLQLYRDTPYRSATVQGRDEAGRRDDQVLFCALTNPSILQPWVEALARMKTPLAGIYSSSLLSAGLVHALALQHRHTLLVTYQSGGLRQSYFHDGQLRFSRLTLAADRDGAAAAIAAETDKTRQFLTSTRMLERGEVLNAVVLAPAARVAALQALCRDGRETVFHFVAMERASAKLSLADAPALADPLLLALLARRRPPSHYALGPQACYYQLWRARLGLYAGSAVMGVYFLLWLGVNGWGIVDASRSGARLRAEAQSYERRYRDIMASLPPQVEKTANMKAAVQIERLVSTRAPGPQAMLTMLSAALDQAPDISLVQLDWKVRLPDNRAGSAQPRADNAPAVPVSALLIGLPAKPPQDLHVEAEVRLAQNDYRAALASIQRFTAALARQPRLTVVLEQTPLDVRPTVKLTGKTATAAPDSKAKFTMNLSWIP
ncbi:hypothetical protein [Janthinobacterium fluminis]|uniref:Uncharacterized protein n=1 Tax=Janthinobacterium fluminis TaxID=2987524 RepID=A0ABT5K4E2_9BURK|nr:hypothetical protein [Janthinobacterium fluminis]MDC8759871.1 hypothetical protein [Janthinobacterium fluminis]